LRDLVQVAEKVYCNRETEEGKEQRKRKKERERERERTDGPFRSCCLQKT
jgi:hypothetical protein